MFTIFQITDAENKFSTTHFWRGHSQYNEEKKQICVADLELLTCGQSTINIIPEIVTVRALYIKPWLLFRHNTCTLIQKVYKKVSILSVTCICTSCQSHRKKTKRFLILNPEELVHVKYSQTNMNHDTLLTKQL